MEDPAEDHAWLSNLNHREDSWFGLPLGALGRPAWRPQHLGLSQTGFPEESLA